MADRTPATNTRFFFDDEPLESILYDDPGIGDGPTPAGLFAATDAVVSGIVQAFERGEADEGIRRMDELLARGDPVSPFGLLKVTVLIESLIPCVPCPIVQDRGVPYGPLLERLFAAALAFDDGTLLHRSGTLLYRFLEGCGRYGDAVRVVGTLLERAIADGKCHDEAVLTNNLGYDYLLNQEWDRAESCFDRAIALFSTDHGGLDRLNARLNHLLARYEKAGGNPPERLGRKLNRFLAALGKDWRRRKALIPLARIAERRGDLDTAIAFARQAVEAAEGIPTRHALDDKRYLEHLEGILGKDG